jgi:NADP-dependent 3-hydroxy acid dehydrogenase YdfG
MAEFKPVVSAFSKLKSKVVVLSGTVLQLLGRLSLSIDVKAGGSTGIGAATARLLHQHGAQVVFGDVNKTAAEELVQAHQGVEFRHCDVTKYDDIYDLFRYTHDKYKRVDHAMSCAGIFEQGNW